MAGIYRNQDSQGNSTKKKKEEPKTKSSSSKPRPGSIAEYVAQGGALPGAKGFDVEAVKKDVARRKSSSSKSSYKPPIGASAISAFEAGLPEGDPTINKNIFDPNANITLKEGFKMITDNKYIRAIQDFVDASGAREAREKRARGELLSPEEERAANDISGRLIFGSGGTVTLTASTFSKLNTAGVKHIVGKAPGLITNNIPVNTKTIKLTTKIIAKAFSKKAVAFYGAWMASVGMGIWANAEAPEGIIFPTTKFLIPEAQRTGDWTEVNAANELAAEASDMNIWEKIISWSPAGVIPGAINKLKGNAEGVKILTKYTNDQQIKQETGQTEAEYWKQRNIEQAEQEKNAVDYYNEQRKLQVKWEQDAYNASRKAQRKEDRKAYEAEAEYWAKQKELEREKAEADRIAIAEYWLEYRKLAQKISDDNRPSALNFGLI